MVDTTQMRDPAESEGGSTCVHDGFMLVVGAGYCATS
jgi:hypothetical protein